MRLLAAPVAATSAKVAHTALQWTTLLWVAGAVVAALLVIALMFLISRRPKSMEDGMAEWARSMAAVAPDARSSGRRSAAPTPVRAEPRHLRTTEASRPNEEVNPG
jgi:hypothetical protein